MTDAERSEYDDVIRQLMAKVEELVAANTALKADLSAQQTLRSIYSDSSQPATVRVRAAQAALGVETPRLESVPPPLELSAVEIVEPLADLIHRRRARQDELCPDSVDFKARSLLSASRNGGNGGSE
jgi:hypothetical protein